MEPEAKPGQAIITLSDALLFDLLCEKASDPAKTEEKRQDKDKTKRQSCLFKDKANFRPSKTRQRQSTKTCLVFCL